MFDLNISKKMYEENVALATKVFNLNQKATQAFLGSQVEFANQLMTTAQTNATEVGNAKSPKDLEDSLQSSQSKAAELVAKSSVEYINLCKDYLDGVSKLVGEAQKTTKVAVAK